MRQVVFYIRKHKIKKQACPLSSATEKTPVPFTVKGRPRRFLSQATDRRELSTHRDRAPKTLAEAGVGNSDLTNREIRFMKG
jgi:hypothetical protein